MDTQLWGSNQYPHSTGKFKPQLSVLWVLPCSGDFGVQKAKTEACGAAVALCLSCDSSCGGDIWSLTQVSSRCWQAARHMLGKLSVCFPHQHITHFVLTHRAGLPCVWANWLWLGQSPRGSGELRAHPHLPAQAGHIQSATKILCDPPASSHAGMCSPVGSNTALPRPLQRGSWVQVNLCRHRVCVLQIQPYQLLGKSSSILIFLTFICGGKVELVKHSSV